MNINNIITTKGIELISLIDTSELHVREIANKLKCSPGSVSTITKNLSKLNLISIKTNKNRHIIIPNRNNPLYANIKSLINFQKLMNTNTITELMKLGKVGVYGSYAKGTNDELSDLDLWIYTKKKLIDIQPIVSALSSELGIPIYPIVLTDEYLKSLKENDYDFYIRLKLESIILNGDIFERYR